MLKIGLTGGIGSGKSTVVKMFEGLGVPVFVSDIEAKRLMVSSKKIRKGLLSLFGEEVYIDKKLNNVFLAKKIFNDRHLLEEVNALVHPSVRHSFKIWAAKQYHPYVMQESAILFENDLHHFFDKTILVTAPKHLRIQRVIARDACTEEQVLARMSNQWEDERKETMSDFVIRNMKLEDTKQQVIKLHHILMKN
ncbi:MAG: dephospho-CoA kinase [Flavobacteriaceae bacterium]|nr:dephospho-CoA kinase [Flavobacteriaceae bacterium]